jgi:opacity protein-like surface antigen
MKKLATAIAAIALIGTPAFAADMAVKMPVKAPPPAPAPVYSWTGFYIGGNAGWVRERDSGISDFINTAVPGSAFFSNPQSNALSDSGFIGGWAPRATGIGCGPNIIFAAKQILSAPPAPTTVAGLKPSPAKLSGLRRLAPAPA